MPYSQHIQHCQTERSLALSSELAPALARLKARNNKQAAPLLALPFATDDLAEVEALAAHVRTRFSQVLIVGAGGSGLSGRTLYGLQSPFAKPSLHFLENLDPHAMDEMMAHLDMPRTCFIVISKSGSTVETLSQFYVLLDHAKKTLGAAKAAEHFVVITTPSADNPLGDMARECGITSLDHASDIGGRFSVLTNVGLLPAAIAGLDIRAMRAGARKVVEQMESAATPEACDPAVGAAIQVAHMQAGCNISVMLPYCERLAGFSSWYRQIWAESLGKQGKGSTPIRAVGTTDQHSQLQLYLEGPKDKLFHLILQRRAGTGHTIPTPARADVAYLQGKTTGDVMEAEQRATLETLIAGKRPVRLFTLDRLGEEELGGLLMHFMLEVILTADLLGIDPFDQPAVEEGKRLARDYLLSGNL
jgi:glucose-6-phosphate isomerase